MNFIHRICFEVCNDFDYTLCLLLVNLKNCGLFFFICFDQMKVDASKLLGVEETLSVPALKHAFMSISKYNGIYISLVLCGLLL